MYDDYRWLKAIDDLSEVVWTAFQSVDMAGLVYTLSSLAYILWASVQDFGKIVFGLALAVGIAVSLFVNTEGDENA
ncbi:MAG: hypothetical protein HYS83_00565 [Candidatus Blackburnbacteria bacterium]|nr:hypothetical protein [Candidatus Blackburnbacteria bacterium]